MAEYKLAKSIHCAECGSSIKGGRTDKKFCCDSCRNNYNNRIRRYYKNYKIKVDNNLERNHKLLESLIKLGVKDISMSDILNMGFNPSFITSFQKSGCHIECCCYDISFILMDTRIIGIRRLAKLQGVE